VETPTELLSILALATVSLCVLLRNLSIDASQEGAHGNDINAVPPLSERGTKAPRSRRVLAKGVRNAYAARPQWWEKRKDLLSGRW